MFYFVDFTEDDVNIIHKVEPGCFSTLRIRTLAIKLYAKVLYRVISV